MPSTNTLYLAVMPLIHVTPNSVLGYGLTEETITVHPSREFATEFSSEQVTAYMEAFMSRANKYLIGGEVVKWEAQLETLQNGRVIVRVLQHVK